MAVMEIHLPSGFVVDKDTLPTLESSERIKVNFKENLCFYIKTHGLFEANCQQNKIINSLMKRFFYFFITNFTFIGENQLFTKLIVYLFDKSFAFPFFYLLLQQKIKLLTKFILYFLLIASLL